jgi:hypothetical protein
MGVLVSHAVLPAAYHVVRQVQGLDPDRAQWCNTARERILELMSLIGGGELEVEIRRDILEDVGEDNSAAEYATPAIALARALCAAGRQHEAKLGRHAEALDLKQQALAPRRRM